MVFPCRAPSEEENVLILQSQNFRTILPHDVAGLNSLRV